MSWTSFLLWLGATYMFYYAINLLYDYLPSKAVNLEEDEAQSVLYFETNEPLPIHLETETNNQVENGAPEIENHYLYSGQITSTGAVSLQQIQELARDELIEFKKKIPY